MIITVKKEAPQQEIDKLIQGFEKRGLQVTLIHGDNYNVFGLVGDTAGLDDKTIRANPFVEEVTRIAAPYKKANRLFHPQDSVIDVAGIKIGGNEKIVVIGGPCSIEGANETLEIAEAVKDAGADMLSRELPRMHFRVWEPKACWLWWKHASKPVYRSSLN